MGGGAHNPPSTLGLAPDCSLVARTVLTRDTDWGWLLAGQFSRSVRRTDREKGFRCTDWRLSRELSRETIRLIRLETQKAQGGKVGNAKIHRVDS